jgi:small subunit ribosomal protein S4
MRRGPKEKRERSLGERLQLKATRCRGPKCALVRRPHPPGVHGPRGSRRPLSDFGRQIREKQKFKVAYGLNERNLRQLFRFASKTSGSTATRLVELLERRLDNVVFRLGLAGSRSAARQLIVHGHVAVNGKRVRAPGYSVQLEDVIGIRPESATRGAVCDLRETLKQYDPPSWLALDLDKLEGRMVGRPEGTSVPFEVNLLVESFSK